MKINLTHKEMTDEECLQNVKLLYQKHPNIVMNPNEWKKLRLEQLKKEGKVWSK